MDQQEYESISSIYEFVFERILPKYYQPFSELDLSIMHLKDRLILEFDRMHVLLNISSDEALHLSLSFVINALNKLSYATKAYHEAQEEDDADKKKMLLEQVDSLKSQSRMDFNTAHNEAVKCFMQSKDFNRKALSAKIRIITILHLNNYHTIATRAMNLAIIEEFIMIVWEEFIVLGDIKQAIYNEFEGSMIRNGLLMMVGDREARKHILLEVTRIRALIGQILIVYLPIPGTKEAEIDISSITDTSLSGHSDFIQALTIFGSRLYSGSADNSIKIWDISADPLSSHPIGTLYGHHNEVVCMISSQGRLYSGSKDHVIKIWDISSDIIPSYPLATLADHSFSVYALAVDYDDISGNVKRLYSGSGDKTIKIWSMTSSSSSSSSSDVVIPSTPIMTLSGHTDDINALVTYNGRLYSGSWKMIMIWDVKSDPIPAIALASLPCHKDWVNTLIISEHRLFSGSTDAIMIWDLHHPDDMYMKSIGSLHDEGYDVNKLIIEEGRLYSGVHAQDTSVVIWDIHTDPAHAQHVGMVAGGQGTIFALAVAGGRLYTGSNGENISVRWV